MKEFILPLTLQEHDELPPFVTAVSDAEVERNIEESWGRSAATVLMVDAEGERWVHRCRGQDVDRWLCSLAPTVSHLSLTGAALVLDLLQANLGGVTRLRAAVGVLGGGELFTIRREDDVATLQWMPDAPEGFAHSYVAPLRVLVNVTG